MRLTHLCLAVLMGACLAAAIAPCSAQGGPVTGRPEIAFVRSRDVKGVRVMDLMVMDADGTHQTVLHTRGGEGILAITRPVWSADLDPTTAGFQGYIVYQHMLQANWPLYAVEVRENGAGQFAWAAVQPFVFALPEGTTTFRPWHPAWSPDGRWLAISAEATAAAGGSASGVYLLEAPLLGAAQLGGQPRLAILRPPVCPPYVSWDAGSKALAFSSGYGLLTQTVMDENGLPLPGAAPDPAGTVVTNAFPPDSNGFPQVSRLSWGPRGVAFAGVTMVATTGRKGVVTYQAVYNLYVADPAAQMGVPLSALDPVPDTTGLTDPCWTPDGSCLLTRAGSSFVKIDWLTGARETVASAPKGATYSWPAWRPACLP